MKKTKWLLSPSPWPVPEITCRACGLEGGLQGPGRRLIVDSPELRVAFCVWKVCIGPMVVWKRYFMIGERAELTFQYLKVLS